MADKNGDEVDKNRDKKAEGDGAAEGDARVTGSRKTGPSPAATAASRARRIGGVGSGATAADRSAKPVSTVKTGKPAGSDATRPVTSKDSDSVNTPDSAASLKKQAVADRARDGLPSASTRDGDQTVVTQVPAWLRWAPAAILVGAAVAMIAFVAVSGHGVWYAKPSPTSTRDKVVAAAKTCTAATNTYRYTTFAADEKKGLACTTGEQSDRYKKAMETLIKATAVKLKASQIAQVNTAAVETIAKGGRQWTILLFGQLTVNTTQTKSGGRIDPFAAQVVMQRVGGKWLISQINPVSSPT